MIRSLERLLDHLVAAGIVVLSGLVFWQFTSRYLLSASLAWSEEVATFVMIWSGLLGLVSLMRNGDLIAIDLSHSWGWRPARVGAKLIALIATIFFLGLIFAVGLEMSVLSTTTSLSSAARIPVRWVYLIFPITAALILTRLILRSWRNRGQIFE
jgi:TRAP-type C4-dicarboxylate transport system permease small subunit